MTECLSLYIWAIYIYIYETELLLTIMCILCFHHKMAQERQRGLIRIIRVIRVVRVVYVYITKDARKDTVAPGIKRGNFSSSKSVATL